MPAWATSAGEAAPTPVDSGDEVIAQGAQLLVVGVVVLAIQCCVCVCARASRVFALCAESEHLATQRGIRSLFSEEVRGGGG